jgi:hypothetical protein
MIGALSHSVALGKAMAGKAKNAEGKLDAVIACRLTAAENDKYKGQVTLSGLSSGEYLRKLIVERPVQIVARPRPSIDKARLIYLYNKASNNLNQIARRLNLANQAKQVDADIFERTLGQLISLDAFLRGRIADVD